MVRVAMINQEQEVVQARKSPSGSPASCSCFLPLFLYYLSSGGAHLRNRALTVARIDVDRAHCILQRLNAKTFFQCVEHGALYTVVRSESANPNLFNAEPSKL